jgi:hypothetical protein
MTNSSANDWKPYLYYDDDNASTISVSLPNILSELDFDDLSSIFCLDTWNLLSDDERNQLRRLLPSTIDDNELKTLLSSLFNGSNFFFGNPIKDFLYHLKMGHYNPNISQYRHAMREVYKLNNIRETKEHIDSLIRKGLEFQKQIGIPVDETLYKEFFCPSNLPSEEISTKQQLINEGQKLQTNAVPYNLRKKRQNERRHVNPDEEMDFENSTDDEDESSISRHLQNIDREIKLVELQRRILDKKKRVANRISDEPPSKKPNKVLTAAATNNEMLENLMNDSPSNREGVTTVANESGLSIDNEESTLLNKFLQQETPTSNRKKGMSRNMNPSPPKCGYFFVFSSLRKIFEKNNNQMTVDDIVSAIAQDIKIKEQIPPNCDTKRFVQLTLNYLHHSQAPTHLSLATNVVVPEPSTATWKWVADPQEVTAEKLERAEQLFFFALCRHQIITTDNGEELHFDALKAKGGVTINPTPPHLVEEFRQQERERFKNCDKPFVYVQDGVKSVVSPVKGTPATQGKARDHPLLKPDRPSAATVLALARDAASRLPGGVGTRADIVVLIRDSQYIREGISDVQLNHLVSGALDRLQGDLDPCVRYDSEQKLWVYLHRLRTVDSFAVLSSKRRKSSSTPSYSPPLASIDSQPPPRQEPQPQSALYQRQQSLLSPQQLPSQQKQQTEATTTIERKKSTEPSSILPAVIHHLQVFPPAVRSSPPPLSSTSLFSSVSSLPRNPLNGAIGGQSDISLQKSLPTFQNSPNSLQQK